MTVSTSTKQRRPNHDLPGFDSNKARIALLFACLWPFLTLALFEASAPHVESNSGTNSNIAGKGAIGGLPSNLRFNFRNVIDRVDVLGYGPTHPRIGVVIVGDDKDSLVTTIESVFRQTDLNRIFVVCVVVDGHEEDSKWVEEFQKIDKGAIPHWHGLRPDIHKSGDKKADEEDPHGSKVHVIFNPKKRGVAESRADAVEFIELLSKYHEDAGLKSHEEDLILLLMQGGAALTNHRWLSLVTDALIVPPPILGTADTTVSMKLANAVAFNLEGSGMRTSFDPTFTKIVSKATADEINQSSGASYLAPALNGAVVAMRLETYANLPARDLTLADPWLADLDLALNLWLCADGIDMLKDVEATTFQQNRPGPLAPEMAARFAAVWMDEVAAKKFYNAYSQSYKDLTYLEWQTYQSKARGSESFPKDLPHRCRSFLWYAEKINPDLSLLLEQSETINVVATGELPKQGNDNQHLEDGIKGAKSANDHPHDQPPPLPEVKVVSDDIKQKLPDKPLPLPAVKEDDTDTDSVSIPQRKDKRKPAKPLCDECLAIVQKAKPVDISYVDVTGGHKEHPHLGARDVNGNLGYIHDETALRTSPPQFDWPQADLRAACLKRDNNYKMLKEKVVVDLEAHEAADKAGKKRDKIFCLVYTTDSGHPKIPLIRETWGPKCDGFMVGSNKTDPSIGAVDIPHEGPEEYNNIWQKVRSMWSYIYDNYYEKYDWFHIGGDDLYLIVENLRLYLESEEIKTAANGGIYLPDGDEKTQVPLFLGRRFAYQGDMDDIFNSGGSGYTLNKAALKALVVDGFPKFFPHAHTFSEDTMVARVFRNMGVFPYETKDENGGERYMPFMPGHHYGYRMPEDHSKDWYATYSINIKEGVDHCSRQSVAFHYVKGDAMKRLHALLYHLCPADTQ